MEKRKELIPTDHPDGTRTLEVVEYDEDGNREVLSVATSTGKHPILRLEQTHIEVAYPDFGRKPS